MTTPVSDGDPTPNPEGGSFVVVRWPDGSTTRGETAADVFATLAQGQWDEQARADVRAALRHRVQVMTGSMMTPGLSDDEFLNEMQALGLVAVERS